MKRLLALMLCLCVMGISAAVSEEIPDWFAAENAKNPSYLLHFVDVAGKAGGISCSLCIAHAVQNVL